MPTKHTLRPLVFEELQHTPNTFRARTVGGGYLTIIKSNFAPQWDVDLVSACNSYTLYFGCKTYKDALNMARKWHENQLLRFLVSEDFKPNE